MVTRLNVPHPIGKLFLFVALLLGAMALKAYGLTQGNTFEANFFEGVWPTLLLVVCLLDRRGIRKATWAIEKASEATLKSRPAEFLRPELLSESLKAEK
jgi:hypothetical protein